MKRLVIALMLFALPLAAMDWKRDLIDSTNALKAGEYERALKIDDRVVDQMAGLLGSGDPEMYSFALALTHKAIALAGLGRNDDALWYWHEALSFHPGFANADLAAFGAPGEFLKAHPIEPFKAPHLTSSSNITAPKVEKHVEPHYPEGARQLRVRGPVIVETLIDSNGVVRGGRVLQTPAPALGHAALEAVRKWRFSPATQDGQPVEVIFNLTINFKLH